MPANLIREIVAERIRERYGSIYRYAKIIGVPLDYLSNVLAGRKVSRPLIFRIAKDLNMPELCFMYESFLHEIKSAGTVGVSQSKKSSDLDKTREEG